MYSDTITRPLEHCHPRLPPLSNTGDLVIIRKLSFLITFSGNIPTKTDQPSEKEKANEGLSGVVIAGIVIGSIISSAIVVCTCVYVSNWRERRGTRRVLASIGL